MTELSGRMLDDLKAVVARAVDVSVTAIQILPRPPIEHQSNYLYDMWADERHLILKEYREPQEFTEAPMREFRALKVMAPLDVAPRPVIVRTDPDPPFGPLVIYEYMEGDMWDRRAPSAADLTALAEIWLRTHAVEQEDLWLSRGYERPLDAVWARLSKRLEASIAQVGAMSRAGRAAADLCAVALRTGDMAVRELVDQDPPLCFCRADARFANVIRRPDKRLGLVDWEDSGLRDPARDVADILTHPNQEDVLSPDEWQSFLRPYLAGREAVDPQIRRRVHLYLAIFPLFWLATLLDQGIRLADTGQLNGWTINELPANVRMQRYLARALAWPATDITNQRATLGDLQFFP